MAPSDVSSIYNPLLQTSKSSTQDPTTVTTCEKTETKLNEINNSDFKGNDKRMQNQEKGTNRKVNEQGKENDTFEDYTQIQSTHCICDGVVEEVTKENDSEKQEKMAHNPNKGNDPKIFAQGKENKALEDNTQTKNTPYACGGVVEEGTKENDSEEQEKTKHNPDKGNDPKTFTQGKENDTVEDNTQIGSTHCTCDGVVEEVTKESDSEEQEKTTHNPDKGNDPKTFSQGTKNGTLEDNTQIENTPCTCNDVVEEVTKESDSEEQEKTTHNPDKGNDPKTFGQGKENDTLEDNTQIGNTHCNCDGVVEEVTKESDSEKEKTTHNPDKGNDPKTFSQGTKSGTLEDNTQIENNSCTCDSVIEELTKE